MTKPLSPEVQAIMALVRIVYSYSDTGSMLHTILDDGNLEDDSIRAALQGLNEVRYPPVSLPGQPAQDVSTTLKEWQLDLEIVLGKLLLDLPYVAREFLFNMDFRRN